VCTYNVPVSANLHHPLQKKKIWGKKNIMVKYYAAGRKHCEYS
jgi:hypothetical protein